MMASTQNCLSDMINEMSALYKKLLLHLPSELKARSIYWRQDNCLPGGYSKADFELKISKTKLAAYLRACSPLGELLDL